MKLRASWFFFNKLLSRLRIKKRRLIYKIRNKKGNIATDTTEMQRHHGITIHNYTLKMRKPRRNR